MTFIILKLGLFIQLKNAHTSMISVTREGTKVDVTMDYTGDAVSLQYFLGSENLHNKVVSVRSLNHSVNKHFLNFASNIV